MTVVICDDFAVTVFSRGLRSELARLGLSQARAGARAWPGELNATQKVNRWVTGKNDPGVMDAYAFALSIGTTLEAIISAGERVAGDGVPAVTTPPLPGEAREPDGESTAREGRSARGGRRRSS
jgi:hypothetical protein